VGGDDFVRDGQDVLLEIAGFACIEQTLDLALGQLAAPDEPGEDGTALRSQRLVQGAQDGLCCFRCR